MGQLKEKCLVIGCLKLEFCKHFCRNHYKAFHKYGDPLKRLKRSGNQRKKSICKVSNCNRFIHGQGLCNLHYRRLRTHGDINKSLINRGIKLKCKIIGCGFNVNAFGMCLKHYKQQYYKNNPEKSLASNIKQHKKYGSMFNLNDRQYKWALQSWTKSVRKRDNHICQICGIRNEKLNIAHHIIPKIIMPKLSLNLNNGITLCRKCHYEVHWGKKY